MTRNKRPSSRQPAINGASHDAPDPPKPAIAWSADWLAQQVAVAGESTAVLFRGLESMRRIQTEAVQETSRRHAGTVGSLGGNNPAAVLATQAALLRQDMETAARCWQELAGAVIETNAELWGSTFHLVKTEDAFNLATHLFHA